LIYVSERAKWVDRRASLPCGAGGLLLIKEEVMPKFVCSKPEDTVELRLWEDSEGVVSLNARVGNGEWYTLILFYDDGPALLTNRPDDLGIKLDNMGRIDFGFGNYGGPYKRGAELRAHMDLLDELESLERNYTSSVFNNVSHLVEAYRKYKEACK
jgi:hypothetical protein